MLVAAALPMARAQTISVGNQLRLPPGGGRGGGTIGGDRRGRSGWEAARQESFLWSCSTRWSHLMFGCAKRGWSVVDTREETRFVLRTRGRSA